MRFGGQRGMHGSFGTTDVHNTLIASGPSFKSAAVLTTPTGNVDVAPTVAYLLGLSMDQADGRVINEALVAPKSVSTPSVAASVLTPGTTATGLRFELATDPNGASADAALTKGSYSINLTVKDLTVDGRTYRYFDCCPARRRHLLDGASAPSSRCWHNWHEAARRTPSLAGNRKRRRAAAGSQRQHRVPERLCAGHGVGALQRHMGGSASPRSRSRKERGRGAVAGQCVQLYAKPSRESHALNSGPPTHRP